MSSRPMTDQEMAIAYRLAGQRLGALANAKLDDHQAEAIGMASAVLAGVLAELQPQDRKSVARMVGAALDHAASLGRPARVIAVHLLGKNGFTACGTLSANVTEARSEATCSRCLAPRALV